jgi:hypothetical protein
MIVAAGLIGFSQARLPRPVRDYRDRVTVEMPALALHDTIPVGSEWAARDGERLRGGFHRSIGLSAQGG